MDLIFQILFGKLWPLWNLIATNNATIYQGRLQLQLAEDQKVEVLKKIEALEKELEPKDLPQPQFLEKRKELDGLKKKMKGFDANLMTIAFEIDRNRVKSKFLLRQNLRAILTSWRVYFYIILAICLLFGQALEIVKHLLSK